MRPAISFIFPVHNEALYIRAQLKKFVEQLPTSIGKNTSYEILMVENGSQDNSWNVISQTAKQNKHVVALRIEKASYGRAVKHGLLAAQGRQLVVLNIDFFPMSFVFKALQALRDPKVLAVVGSKLLHKGHDQRGLVRHLASTISHTLIKVVTGYQGTDTHGVKVFKKTPELKTLIYQCNALHELFDTELIVKVAKLGSVLEVPVRIREYRPTRYIHVKRWLNTAFDISRVAISPVLHSVMRINVPKDIIVTADDYGRVDTGTQAIVDLAKLGSVTTVSVLANSVEQRQLISLQKQPVKIGLHFNLTFGEPMVKETSLSDQNSDFYSLPELLLKLLFKKIPEQEIQRELLAQLHTLDSLGAQVQYIDGEQHIHLLPPIKQVVSSVAKKRKLLMRDRCSTILHLQKKPIRLLTFLLMEKILTLLYPGRSPQPSSFSSVISHPGLDYD